MSDNFDDKDQQSVFDDDTYQMWDEENSYGSYQEYQYSLDEEEIPRPEPSFWQMLFRKIWPTLEERRESALSRLSEFDDTIEAYPKTAGNYVFRGEIYLETGQLELAIDDFRLATELATAELKRRDWGIVAQMIRDRAQQGLKKAQKRLA